ncbi:S-layer homology domain-containing protein [Caryophanon tenue]|uniref:SLH domain-containing protein n=1 Tax=Caryophanon tenue TaxID=33978 RepID=A0A1C0YJS4_9BACL|nr:S-layer homology domain-containing protein [Caryophanon tenue]OCS87437.1 hypothetical protein A6M13_08955 [Caryophanon tenue]
MKKNIFLASSAALVISAVMPVGASAMNFTDLTQYDETTQQAVDYLVEKKVVHGTSPTTFSPRQNIKRGQVVKMLGKYLKQAGMTVPTDWATKARFTDVPTTTSDQELLQYAALVYDSGIFVGSNGQLNASGNLTRENVALVLNRLAVTVLDGKSLIDYVKENQLATNIKDLQSVKEEAREAVYAFNALKISNVDNFNPKGNVQRIHFASFLAKVLQVTDKIKLDLVPEEKPEEPVRPEVPEEKPEESVKPEVPEEKPEEPVRPEVPEEKPEESVKPEVPEEKPEESVRPEVPEETPEESVKPEVPEEKPEEPVKPEIPEETPEEQEASDNVDWEDELPEEVDSPLELPDENQAEDTPTYYFNFEDVNNVEIISTTANKVVIQHATYGEVTLNVTPDLQKLFSEVDLLKNANVSLYVEEDVIQSVNEVVIKNNGTHTTPINVDGSLFEELTDITVQATYANVVNFDNHYGSVKIVAPANAVYTVENYTFDEISSSGLLNITFTESVDTEIIIDAPTATVTVASGVTIDTLAPKNNLSIIVQPSAIVHDVYVATHISSLNVSGKIENVTAETPGAFTITGTGIIDTLYGAATTVYVQLNGVTVNYLAVDETVENVTVQ